MELYFSGLAGQAEAAMLRAAGVGSVLADPTDRPFMDGFPHRALDCGSYRLFKQGRTWDDAMIGNYLAAADHAYREGALQWWAWPDVIGDDDASFALFFRFYRKDLWGGLPVWQWGGQPGHLHTYLGLYERVGIGGLVPAMRVKDEGMLVRLSGLCRQYPNRLHLFGINWLHAIETLRNVAASGDTSKWLDAGRYGHVIFRHTVSGHLQQAPARVIPQYAGLDRVVRCVESARALCDFCRSVD